MITLFILNTIGFFLTVVFQALPDVTSLNITVPGVDFTFPVDNYLSTGMGYIHYLINIFPPLGTMYYGFLTILAWKTILLVLRLFKVIR